MDDTLALISVHHGGFRFAFVVVFLAASTPDDRTTSVVEKPLPQGLRSGASESSHLDLPFISQAWPGGGMVHAWRQRKFPFSHVDGAAARPIDCPHQLEEDASIVYWAETTSHGTISRKSPSLLLRSPL